MFSAKWFLNLDKTLREQGLDSDSKSFDEIKARLENKNSVAPDCFADECSYVILAGGFSQKTAKKIHKIICEKLRNGAGVSELLSVFNNKNKINAIVKVWQNREKYCDDFYILRNDDEKILYLQKLPHIGKITANHLARNLGINVVKYDIWIQRLGVAFATQFSKCKIQSSIIDNKKLNPEIKKYCDDMFEYLAHETKMPIGYIDVVLWKACQNHLIKELKNGCCKN